jgi:hypothetical protein
VSETRTIELLDLSSDLRNKDTRAWISEAWPHAITYRGVDVMDAAYGRGFELQAELEKLLPESNQECYLGYVLAGDFFIVGFDAWADSDEWTGEELDAPVDNVFSFRVTPARRRVAHSPIDDMNNMFYANKCENLKKLRERFPSLIDLRLD